MSEFGNRLMKSAVWCIEWIIKVAAVALAVVWVVSQVVKYVR
jgi:hypothetical protein